MNLNSVVSHREDISLSCKFSFFLGAGSHYVSLADLHLSLQTRIALRLQRSTCLWCQRARIKGVHYHTTILGVDMKPSFRTLLHLCW